MKEIIKTEKLVFSYGSSDPNVLNEIDISLESGSFIAVVGANGSGKSTLAKHFNAILLPSGGRVYVCGMDTLEEKNIFKIRAGAGMVFQNPDSQLVAAIVEDEAAFAPENLGVAPAEIRRRVDEALKITGMSEYALRATANLSGGQKQRAAVAGVLAMEPRLIIFDEATAMIDPRGRKDIMRAVKRINREKGTTVVFITHYMDEAAQADRIIVMDGGRIAADGEPREIFSNTELLERTGLEVPQSVWIANELRKAGINIRADILSAEELCEEVIRLYDKD